MHFYLKGVYSFLTKMPELEQKTFQRQIAYKVRISDILNIKLNEGSISRVNVIATVVYKSEQQSTYASAVVDDGTGKILLRSFENKDVFSKADVGDLVLVIGKAREFNNERYLIPEILKKINNVEWTNVRKLELKNFNVVEDKNIKTEGKSLVEDAANANEEIYLLIRKLDTGEGALIDDVIRNSNNSEAENIINKLLKNGDIFEIKPGKLKVLE